VCGPCLKGRVVRDPVTVVDVGHGSLSPRCARHVGTGPGVPAAAIEWELLNTYGVELLPQQSIPRRARRSRSDGGLPKPARVGMWALTAVFMVIRFAIGLMFTLWLIGIALMIVGAVVGGIAHVFGAGTSSPTATVATPTNDANTVIDTLGAYLSRSELRFRGVEPHRGAPRVAPPPRIAMPCGVGRGDHIEFVPCSGDFDLIGFGEQSDPRGVAKDCLGPTDAYSSGPHWHVCWLALGDPWIDPFPSSPNPFVHPLGGALF
jgi:hypothetical protein